MAQIHRFLVTTFRTAARRAQLAHRTAVRFVVSSAWHDQPVAIHTMLVALRDPCIVVVGRFVSSFCLAAACSLVHRAVGQGCALVLTYSRAAQRQVRDCSTNHTDAWSI
jgi:hypothetical protein